MMATAAVKWMMLMFGAQDRYKHKDANTKAGKWMTTNSTPVVTTYLLSDLSRTRHETSPNSSRYAYKSSIEYLVDSHTQRKGREREREKKRGGK